EQNPKENTKRLQKAADIRSRNGKQRKWPEQFPREMTGPPELKCTNGRNQNVKDKRSRTNDRRRKPEECHRGDITRCASVTDRRIEESDDADCEKKKNEMRRVHE